MPAAVPFAERLAESVLRCRSVLCVGIDPHPDRMPLLPDMEAESAALEGVWGEDAGLAVRAKQALEFGEAVIEACAGRVPAVKPQSAFFEALGAPGMVALSRICRRARAAGLLVIMDAKRGDIASTAAAYARAYFGPEAPFPCDALTVSPYLGPDSIAPFVEASAASGGGLFVLVRTSNPGAEAWQARIAGEVAAEVERLSGAEAAGRGGSGYGSVGAVIGATWPEQIREFRARMPHAWMLLPGFGAQGGTAETVRAAFDARGLGALVVGARGLTFPEQRAGADPAEQAAWAADPAPFIRARIAAADAEIRAVIGAGGGAA